MAKYFEKDLSKFQVQSQCLYLNVNARFISQQFLRVGTIANISGLRVEQKLATAVSSPVVAYQLYRYERGVGCPEVILSTREFQTCERA